MDGLESQLADIRFALYVSADLPGLLAQQGRWQVDPAVVDDVLSSAAAFAVKEFAPLYRLGDIKGASLADGRVSFPTGFRAAYQSYASNGWNSLGFARDVGGQGFPLVIATAVNEIWNTANVALGLAIMPVGGAVRLLQAYGNAWQKRFLIPPLVQGRWGATMSMTESHAGSDIGLARCKAIPHADGTYRLFGQKVLISVADHDLVETVLQFVLARLPEAADGVRGLTLFACPTRLIGEDGSLGDRNDVRYVSLEHKLGVRAMPTGVVQYGEAEGAVAFRVGQAGRGLECLFTLMNRARIAIALLALGNAERAYRHAVEYAKTRVQGRGTDASGPVAIINHPDVRRMLTSMKARVEAIRHLCLYTASLIDRGDLGDGDIGALALKRVALLTPVLKSYATEQGFDIVSTGMQIFGGAGYIEETGVPQYLRDARVHPIYEGTTGIQAIDFLTRKVAGDGGATLNVLLNEVDETADQLLATADLTSIGRQLRVACADLRRSTEFLLTELSNNKAAALAVSVPHMMLAGNVIAAWLMARAALAALATPSIDPQFASAKIGTARFFLTHQAVTSSLRDVVLEGGPSALSLSANQF